eukprot:m.716994 g.716994  ORF g.716994 m.716994 type:complete len:417 (+) comp22984_c1_seq78:184-1434(+)
MALVVGALRRNFGRIRQISDSINRTYLSLLPTTHSGGRLHAACVVRYASVRAATCVRSATTVAVHEDSEQYAGKLLAEVMMQQMDRVVVGQLDVKRAIVLGLLAREHVYIEGPPGTGKTMIAEEAAHVTDLSFYFYQMHRDTRLQELVGDSVIVRDVDDRGGEIIRQEIQPGGITTAALCVLDDISRAPGEALNVLLRILNERKFGNEDIPLLSAIATANPADQEYYNEPLDPANIDRFSLQIKTAGLIEKQDWASAASVIDLYANDALGVRRAPARINADKDRISDEDPAEQPMVIGRDVLDRVYAEVENVGIGDDLKRGLLVFLHTLSTQHGLTERNSLLTDRTFLVKALKLIKAHACAEGRHHADLSDLNVLAFMTTFRVPSAVHDLVPSILQRIQEGTLTLPTGDAGGDEPH